MSDCAQCSGSNVDTFIKITEGVLMAVRININRAPLGDDTTFVNMVFEFGMNSTTNDKRRNR